MNVYLVRHGHAVPAGTVVDDLRWLTERGRAEIAAVVAKLQARGVRWDLVLTSPLVRAVQTAELLAAGVGYDGPIEALAELEPGGAPGRIAGELAARGVSVAAVGHEPTISALASYLASRSIASFRTGQVVCITGGTPAFSLTP